MFDWISIVFWVVIAFRILMGFIKGGFKTLVMLLVAAAGIGLAFLLCNAIGGWIGDLGTRDAIYNAVNGRISTVSVSLGAGNLSLGSEINRADLETAHAMWVAAGNTGTTEDMVRVALHEGYKTCFIPQVIYGTIDKMIIEAIPATGTFTLASIISIAIAKAACIGIAFCGVVIITVLIGFIVMIIVSALRKAAGKRPGIVSRLVGMVFGAAGAFLFCWTASIVMQSVATCVPAFNDYITAVMHLNDDAYWNIGKFFFNIKFGYADLLNWFLSLIQIKPA